MLLNIVRQDHSKLTIKSKISILFLSLLLLACQQPPDKAKVIQVIDGDTVVIEGGYHVRYIGINAPEKDEFYHTESKQLNKDLVEGKEVRLETDISTEDKYGRLLRYVFVDDSFVNAEIIRQGYAYAKAYTPDIKYQTFLEAMEREARQKKKGIWSQK